DQAGIADQQVERHRQDAEGNHVDNEVAERRPRPEHGQDQQDHQRGEGDQQIAEKGREAHAHTSFPKRPLGLMTSTSPIITNMMPSTKSGKPTEPKARVSPMMIAATKAPPIEPIPP